MENYIFFLIYTLVLELITALIATINWRKYSRTTEKYFLHFIWLTFFTDFFGSIILAYCFNSNNYALYNSYKIFVLLFLLNWYHTILKNNVIVNYALIVYLISLFFSFYYESFFYNLQKINFLTGSLILVVCSFTYFIEILKSEILYSLRRSLPFWITIGNLLFFIGVIPLILLFDKLRITYLSFNIVLAILNTILYTSYIIGFIWMKKK